VALLILVNYPWSYAFCNGGLELVFDISTKRLEEPCVDERKRAMDFLTSIISAPGLTKLQRREAHGQAMDFISMAWFLELCLVIQKYNKSGHKGHLEAHALG